MKMRNKLNTKNNSQPGQVPNSEKATAIRIAAILVLSTILGLIAGSLHLLDQNSASIETTRSIETASGHVNSTPQTNSSARIDSHTDSQALPKISGRSLKLTTAQENVFVAELTSVFTDLIIHTIDRDAIRIALSNLNRRGRAGVDLIKKELSRAPTNETEIRQRLGMVDYLKYRIRWDEQVQEDISSIIRSPLQPETSKKYLAAAIMDRAELLNGLAHANQDLAVKLFKEIHNPLLRKMASHELFYSFIEKGLPREIALQEIQKIIPGFRG